MTAERKPRKRAPDTRGGDRHARSAFKARIDADVEDEFRATVAAVGRPLGVCLAEALRAWVKKNRPTGA